jgi:hypothetical protein
VSATTTPRGGSIFREVRGGPGCTAGETMSAKEFRPPGVYRPLHHLFKAGLRVMRETACHSGLRDAAERGEHPGSEPASNLRDADRRGGWGTVPNPTITPGEAGERGAYARG